MTDKERLEQVARSFKRRLILQYAIGLTGLGVVLCVAVTRVSICGISGPSLALLALIPVVVLTLLNWRCPSCNKLLKIGSNPGFCPTCGVRLR